MFQIMSVELCFLKKEGRGFSLGILSKILNPTHGIHKGAIEK